MRLNLLSERTARLDLLVALLVFGLGALVLFANGLDEGPAPRTGDALGLALVAAAVLPGAVARRRPLEAFMVSGAAAVALHSLSYADPLGVLPALSLFHLALAGGGPLGARAAAGLAAALFAVIALAEAAGSAEFDPGAAYGAAIWAMAWFAGDRARLRRERISALEERAERAERETERERRLAAAEERTTIARELHDSAGHAINVILVQAGAARLLHERDPAGSRAALSTVEDVARETIGEIDRLVSALRDDRSADDGAVPVPGVEAVRRLVDARRGAGLAVELRSSGDARRLAPGVDTAAYRIVQESLTNAARHGGGRADVTLSYGPGTLEVEVVNPLRAGSVNGSAERGGGHGIVGMRERAVLLGGGLEAGPAGSEFRVLARLPYDAAPSA